MQCMLMQWGGVEFSNTKLAEIWSALECVEFTFIQVDLSLSVELRIAEAKTLYCFT